MVNKSPDHGEAGHLMSSIDLRRHRELLGKVIESRRNELGIPRERMVDFGGPTHQTVYELERAKKDRCSARTLSAVERALKFQHNTLVEQVLNRGEKPIELPVLPTVAPEPQPEPHPEPDAKQAVSRDALHRMMTTMGKIYGSAVIMDVAAQVVAELEEENTEE